ncbi:MAG: zinc-ribbon domain-containing protein [Candidatus Micrarchaeota archaeon]|nr:zinc-ribbon domain-containing protein [Candidatus Micrarchaeota archaeon]
MPYVCAHCGNKIKQVDSFVRCNYCGHRVLVKSRPGIAREVSTD